MPIALPLSFLPSPSLLELRTTENMPTVRALWPALKPLILLLQDSFTTSEEWKSCKACTLKTLCSWKALDGLQAAFGGKER